MNLGFEVEAAKPKRQSADDDAPRQMPMRAGLNPAQRRNPTTDDKKVRHQMRRQQTKTAASDEAIGYKIIAGDGQVLDPGPFDTADDAWDVIEGYGGVQASPAPIFERDASRHEGSGMDTSIQREADLLEAMAHASLPEQRRLAADLDALRATRRLAFEDDRDTDLAAEIVADHLTPVMTHALNTTATDWLGEVEDEAPDTSAAEQMATAEASLWWGRTHEAVRADRQELAEQAMGYARRYASQFGAQAEVVHHTFLDHVAHLARRVVAEGGQTCAVCGAAIERDPAGEEPRTWHHADGAKHDHEAKPSGDDSSKTSSLRTVADVADLASFEVEAAGTDDAFAFEGVAIAERDRATNPRHGDQMACRTCNADIEYHKGTGWIDRGGNTHCDTSGMHPQDPDTGAFGDYPHQKHQPYSDRTGARTAADDFNWAGASAEEKCAHFKHLDTKFGTDPRSPLHHDNRCPIHGDAAHRASRTAAGDSPGQVDPEQSGEAGSSLPYDRPVADDYDPWLSEDWPGGDQPVIDPPMTGAGEGTRASRVVGGWERKKVRDLQVGDEFRIPQEGESPFTAINPEVLPDSAWGGTRVREINDDDRYGPCKRIDIGSHDVVYDDDLDVEVRTAARTAALSRNCTNGNHSDCSGGSCSCSCHKTSPNRDYSGACADGDHSDCKMPGGTGEDQCACPCHRKQSSRVVRGEVPWNAGYADALAGRAPRVASKDVGTDPWYYTEGYLAGHSSRMAAVGDPDDGVRGIPEEIKTLENPDDRPMWPWDLEEPGSGAADVANAPNPNDHTGASRTVWSPETGWTDEGDEVEVKLDEKGRIKTVPKNRTASTPGAGGWPIVEGPHPGAMFPDEPALTCPKCGSNRVVMGAIWGPGGRMGDPGALEYNECQNCGFKQHYEPKNKMAGANTRLAAFQATVQANLQREAVAWGRRHYEDMASVISKHPDRAKLATHFANALDGTNPNYRKDQFEKAAQSEGYSVRGGTGTANYSKGHYETVAKAISRYDGDRAGLASHFADHFAKGNPRFNRQKFVQYASTAAADQR